MERQIGIPKAVDATGRRFDRSAVGQVPEPFVRPLHCGGCSIPVTVQSPYSTQRGTSVAGSFKRMPKGAEHDQGCAFAFDARVGQLLEEHRAEIERDQGRYVLLLRELLAKSPAPEVDEPVADPRSRLQVSTNSGTPRVPATLQAASQIARLLEDFDDADDVAEQFVASYQGRRVTWRQFFYRADREALRLTAYLEGKPWHPIAVQGVVHSVRPSVKGDTWSAELRLGRRLLTKTGEQVHVTLRAERRESLGVDVGQIALGYGQWSLWQASKSKAPAIYAQLWCDHSGATAVFQNTKERRT